jgi:predicted membrane-bound spermidine synthase
MAGGSWFHAVIFGVFVCSGFCSLLYQVVWVRLAFSHFGVITPVFSCVLSVFMLGLGLGSLLGGSLARWCSGRLAVSPACLYGAVEGMIGLGAFVVPWLFQEGEDWLLNAGQATSSSSYLFASSVLIFVALLPWCTLMGATVPVMMAFIRQVEPRNSSSFSFLYLANVIGAMAGTILSALVLIELFGFRNTSMIAATINFLLAAVGMILAPCPSGRASGRVIACGGESMHCSRTRRCLSSGPSSAVAMKTESSITDRTKPAGTIRQPWWPLARE